MINLRDGRGKVPVRNSTQHEANKYLMLDFPSREEFDLLYKKHKSVDLRDRYWKILKHRSQGKTLEESGKEFGLTRERVRQIEARFQRLVGERYWSQMEAQMFKLSSLRSLVESFLDSEMHESSPPSDGNR